MKIIITDINKNFISTIQNKISSLSSLLSLDNVETHAGSFTELSDTTKNICLVGAGNSFGILSGGVDLAIKNFFGKQIEDNLQKCIFNDFSGELTVGQSLIMPTLHNGIKLLAYSPTMRIPKSIFNTDIPYTTTLSTLNVIKKKQKDENIIIDTVIFPGLGTGTGKVPYEKAAKQMLLAISNFNSPKNIKTMRSAYELNNNIYG